MADAVWTGWNLAGRGDDIEASLVKYDGVGFDLSAPRVSAGWLILGLHNPVLENSAVNRAQYAVLPLIAFGWHAANVEHLAIGLVMLPDGVGELVFELAPEGFDPLPKWLPDQRVQ